MNKQLALLVQLSDLDTHLAELSMERIRIKEEELGFKLHAQEKEITKLRDSIKTKIQPKLLTLYDRILKRYKYRAVTQVVEGVCYGCFMELPTQFISEEKMNEDIVTCPNCGRLLYWIEI